MTILRRLTLGVALAALLGGTAGASRIPEESKKRAARIEQWQATLAEAAAEAAAGRPERAASLYLSVREQASSAGGVRVAAQATDALADLYRARGRMEQAALLYVEAAALWERMLGERQPRLAVTLHNLGVVYIALGEWENAERSLERALAIWEANLGADSAEAANTRRARDRARAKLAGP